MISVQEIASLVKNPQTIEGDNLDEIKSLCDKYPYTQLFSILYLKGLKSSGDIRFEEELNNHSFRISDRTQLYNLIETAEQKEVAAVADDNSIQHKTEENHLVDEEIIIEEPVQANTEEVTEATIESQNSAVDKVESKDHDPLEQNINHHILAANYQLDDLNEDEIAALEARTLEAEKETEIEEEEAAVVIPKQLDVDGKQSFSAWLNSNANYTEQENSDKAVINAIVTSFDEFNPIEEKLFGEVERPKKPFFSPSKKAKESLSEDSLPVSETLAKIYVIQGNYPKAISAYEQLSLKYPEKKIFFANQIKDLKKQLNK